MLTSPRDEPRKRGGQPGNTNALKSGLWAKARLTAHTVELLQAVEAEAGAGVADVVAVLRVEIARLIEGGDYRAADLAALARSVFVGALAEARLNGGAEQGAAEAALANVLADVQALRVREGKA